ncbi:Cloroperoxidase [Xylariomycetidae sp. FL0641]|nr:Cloroperoxidase [Xylariomycetidae sp. FL0641]
MKAFNAHSSVAAYGLLTLTSPLVSGLEWKAPGPADVRGPCPMLNTLANHGYLPHSGKDITENMTIAVLTQVLNLGADLATYLHEEAVTTNPSPNATTFSLLNLQAHDVLEHDASLSRADWNLGSNYLFNETVYAETRSYWTTPNITLQQAADAQAARLNTSQATNPAFSMSNLGANFALGESAGYMLVFSNPGSKDPLNLNASREWVEYFFTHEKLPVELGWQKPELEVTIDVLSNTSVKILELQGKTLADLPPAKRRLGLSGFHSLFTG